MKAWLVKWEWSGEHAKVVNSVVSVLNPRYSARSVGKIVEQMYVDFTFSFQERLQYAKNKKSNPYRAELQNGEIIVRGHNPWLEARIVKNVHITFDDDGSKQLQWEEIDRSEIWAKARRTRQY